MMTTVGITKERNVLTNVLSFRFFQNEVINMKTEKWNDKYESMS